MLFVDNERWMVQNDCQRREGWRAVVDTLCRLGAVEEEMTSGGGRDGVQWWMRLKVGDVGDRRKTGQKLGVLTVLTRMEMVSIAMPLHRTNWGVKMSTLATL